MIHICSNDGFKVSLEKALDDIDPNWIKYSGLLIGGTHAPEHVSLDWALSEIKKARETNIPVLGICYGLQMGAIEFARNRLNLPDATTAEIDPEAKIPLINALPGVRVGLRMVEGGHLENHWHRYKLNMDYAILFVPYFRMSVTRETDGQDIVEEMVLRGHPFFKLVQYHPEYNSYKDRPHPVLKGFVEACKKIQ